MRLTNLKTVTGFFLGAMLFVTTIGAQENAPTNAQAPQIGSINYVEGQVSINDQNLSAQDVGSTALQAGEVLSTGHGRAEMLLTPGAFVRLDNNSAVELVAPSENQVEIGLDRGRVAVEVADLGMGGGSSVRVSQNGVTTDISTKGLYEFDAERGQVFVLAGAAHVNSNGQQIQMNGGNELALNDSTLRPRSFDPASMHDDFYNWNSSRSNMLAHANQDVAPAYTNNTSANSSGSDEDAYATQPAPDYAPPPAPGYAYGPGWYGAGWYWDPYYSTYTWVPGAGLYYSPFGYGFYSPIVIYRTPFFHRSHFFVGAYAPYYRGFRGGFAAPYRYGYRYDRGRTFGTIPPRVVAPRGGFATRGNFERRGNAAPRGSFAPRGGFSGGYRGGSRGGSFHGGGHGHGH